MLTTTSQYALRALSQLAKKSGEAALGRDLAASTEIPANYLSKVLLVLRNAGFVETARGFGGGYRLVRPAKEIHIIDVVSLFENISRTGPCCFLGRARACSEHMPCSAHHASRDFQKAYLQFLVSTPLSAIVEGATDLQTAAGVQLFDLSEQVAQGNRRREQPKQTPQIHEIRRVRKS
jgi:Rrf2 family iron-sulfur cluster assembly transcriptional regulator